MRKKTKRTLGIGLAMMMAVSMLSGCGGKTSDTSSSAGSDKSQSGGERPTFKVATVRATDAWPTDFMEEGFMKELEEKYNVDIEWQIYYYSDWAEQKSLLLASGDLPDAFFGSLALNDTDVAQNKSSFVDLTDRIEGNMPNLTKAFGECPELKAVCTDRDGRIYSLPKKLPLRPEVCGFIPFINKTWLDNLGLEVPKTYQELEDVLEKFAAEDADGDGNPSNEIPVTNYAAANLLSTDLRSVLSPFGTMVTRGDNYMGLNSEGQPVFMPVQENYRESVKWMHEMYEKGIVDPEYFTQETSMYTSKIQAEGGSKVGLIWGWTEDAAAGVNSGQFIPMPAVEGYDGVHYVEEASDYMDISDRELLITTKCSDPDRLLQWADGFYTDLASLQTFYGSIPDCVTEKEDGTYTVNVPSDGSSLDTSAWSNSFRDYGPKYMNPDFYQKVTLPENQGDGIKLAEDEINKKYLTPGKNCGLPRLHYTEDELSRMASLGTDIYKYCEAQYAHWVVDGGVEKEWDAYLKQLDDMGLQELIKIQDNAYRANQEQLSK